MKPVDSFEHLDQQATSCFSSQYLIDQIQVQKAILVVATVQMPDLTENRK